ncbi:hypothetical protein ACFX2H_012149 [Malus domestica]
MQRPEAPLAPFPHPSTWHVFELELRCCDCCFCVIPEEIQVTELFGVVNMLDERSGIVAVKSIFCETSLKMTLAPGLNEVCNDCMENFRFQGNEVTPSTFWALPVANGNSMPERTKPGLGLTLAISDSDNPVETLTPSQPWAAVPVHNLRKLDFFTASLRQ